MDVQIMRAWGPERVGSQVEFVRFLCGFLEGLTFDLLALAQSKHSFPFSTWPLKEHRFYNICFSIYATFGVGIIIKKHFKIELENKCCKNACFVTSRPK